MLDLRSRGLSASLLPGNSGLLLVEASMDASPGSLQQAALAIANVIGDTFTVEPDYLQFAHGPADDPAFADQSLWGLQNLGGAGGTPGADISAVEAWDIRNESPNTVIGVVDTGTRLTHEDLRENLWVNPGEIPGNGLDDDRNGIVDDVHGFDAVDRDGSPLDRDGHGTHVAGTIAERGNNRLGTTGVAWKAQIMTLRFMDQGRGFTSDAIAAIDYATANGAHILNNSWGGGGFSTALLRAIERSAAADILFVAAAGNEAADNDQISSYPASYDVPTILSVASSDRNDRLSNFSNFGRRSVHLAAPGSAIRSTYFQGDRSYATLSGTSMASPHVAGAAALLRAEFPQESATEIKQRLIDTVDPMPALLDSTISGGRMNLFAALGGNVGDRPGVIAFDEHRLLASETAREVVAIARRRAGSTGSVVASYRTIAQTATANQDFVDTSGTLSWPDGDNSDRTLSIPLLDDAIEDPDESFLIELTILEGEALIGIPSSIEVEILDDETSLVEGFQVRPPILFEEPGLLSASPAPQTAIAPGGAFATASQVATDDGRFSIALRLYQPDGSLRWETRHTSGEGAVFPTLAFLRDQTIAVAYSRITETAAGEVSSAAIAIATFSDDGILLSDHAPFASIQTVDVARAIVQAPNNALIVAGESDFLGSPQALLLWLPPGDTPPARVPFRFASNSPNDSLSDLATTSEGLIVASGWTRSPNGFKGTAIAFDQVGSEQWRRVFETSDQQRALSIAVNEFGEAYIGLRNFNPFSGRFSGIVSKISTRSGGTIWQRGQSLGADAPNFFVANGADGGVLFAEGPSAIGQNASSFTVGSLDRNSNPLFESTLDTRSSIALSTLASTATGQLLLSGSAEDGAIIGTHIIDTPSITEFSVLLAPETDAPEARVSFELERLTLSESAGSFTIAAIRHAGFSSEIRLALGMPDAAATDLLVPQEATFTFAPDQIRSELEIEILNDSLHEPTEKFTFSLLPLEGLPTPQILDPSTFEIQIQDDDDPFETWLSDKFTPNQIAQFAQNPEISDPDRDGLPNLLEFAFDLDPTQPSPAPKLTLSKDSASVTWILEISPPLQSLESSTATLQTSPDLETWTDLQPLDAKAEESEPRQSIPLPPLPTPTFLRIKVDRSLTATPGN